MSVTQVGVWAPLRAAGIVSRLTVLTMKRKHQTLTLTLTHSLKICLKSEAETFTTPPARLKMTLKQLEFNFLSALWRAWALFIPCSSLF